MPAQTPAELLDWLERYQFLRAEQAAQLRPTLAAHADSHSLAKELLRRDWLTPFQANQILVGKGDQLVLGSNRLLQRVGEGSMGQVFKARNSRLARVVAVKTIHKGLVDSPKAMDRFRREIEAAAQLHHPNIVLVRDADEADGRPYLVMEYIDGVTLAQRVKQDGPLPVATAAEYARQAALGLQHAFERGVVHRDIKPGNLLVAGEGPTAQVKILDFGLASFDSERSPAARLTQPGRTLGTIDYIAPEQATDASRADTRADIYSLGCTLYYLLTGRPPFPGTTAEEKVAARLVGEPPSVRAVRPEVPEALDAVLRKMMARHPGDRYQTPAEVAAELGPVAPAAPVAVPLAQPVGPDVPLASPVASPVEGAALAMPVVAPAEGALPWMTDAGPGEQAVPPPDVENVPHAAPPRAAQAAQSGTRVMLMLAAAGGVALVAVLLVSVFAFTGLFRGEEKKKGYWNPGAAVHITKTRLSTDFLRPGDVKFVQVFIERAAFKGPVHLRLEGLPEGVNAGTKTIDAGLDAGEVRISASYGMEPIEATIRVIAAAENLSDEETLKLRVLPEKK